ncbi:MAG: hypothetical protein M3N32_08570 [Actinomycetota bacterium]|nr:hypothetical protein [Actinomycetota bacterium]
MPRQAEVFVRHLTGEEGQRLVRTAHTSRDPVPQRRATILLASAQGRSAEAIAGLLEGSVDYVREVIHAFNAHGFKTLQWGRNGARDDPWTNAGVIAGALATSPWPAPVTWAKRPPGSRPPGHRSEPARPSAPVAHTGNGLVAPQNAQDLAPSPVTLRAQPPRLAGAIGEGDQVRVDGFAPLVLQPPADWAVSHPLSLPGSGPPAPAALTSDERQRLDELERENERLRQERELLKAAAAFFAAESQKT